jgi:CheY-like chemotaxis protein
MNPFKILYIEHETDRFSIKQTLEKLPANVKLISDPDDPELAQALRSTHFDLVITDAMFLPPNCDHETGQDGNYRLGEIIKRIRAIDNKRIQIAVLTQFSAGMILQHSNDLRNADYIWNKDVADLDFLYWQVKSVREGISRRFPEHLLVSRLIAMLDEPNLNILPWRSEMKQMLDAYRSHLGEADQIQAMRQPLSKIGDQLGIGSEFQILLDTIIDAETINVAGKPSAWGHLRHVLNVFWLGYYILNSGSTNHESIISRIMLPPGEKIEPNDYASIVNGGWLICALFHDLGLPGERVSSLAEHWNAVAEIYKNDIFKLTDPGEADFDITKDLLFTQLETAIARGNLPNGGEVLKWLKENCKKTVKRKNKPDYHVVDHGVLSSLAVLGALGTTYKPQSVLFAAASAMCMHNFARAKDVEKLRLNTLPFLSLLVLCDQTQSWDRNTGQENFFYDSRIESVELSKCELSVEQSKQKWEIAINYLPFHYIAPDEHIVDEIERKLHDILINDVLPCLNTIVRSDPNMPHILLRFLLDNRREIANWQM